MAKYGVDAAIERVLKVFDEIRNSGKISAENDVMLAQYWDYAFSKEEHEKLSAQFNIYRVAQQQNPTHVGLAIVVQLLDKLLENKLPMPTQEIDPLFVVYDDHDPNKVDLKAEIEQLATDARNTAIEKRLEIFEHYRTLSYDLNKPQKYDGKKIQEIKTDPLKEYITLNGKMTRASTKQFLVQAPNNAGILQEYDVIRIDTTDNDLVPFLFISRDTTQVPREVRLTFQGTSSLHGWYRNFTGQHGAGINEFNTNKLNMLNQIEHVLKTIDSHIEFSIIGHSLGGADTQNMTVAMMEAMAAGKFPEIKSLNAYFYNSAGVPPDTAKNSVALAKEIKEKGISVSAYSSIVGGDIVQQTGGSMILTELPAEVGEFILVKTQCGKEGVYDTRSVRSTVTSALPAAIETVNAHTARVFTRDKTQVTEREYYVNDTEKDKSAIHTKCQEHRLAQTIAASYQVGQTLKGGIKAAGQMIGQGEGEFNRDIVRDIINGRIERKDAPILLKEILTNSPEYLTSFFKENENHSSYYLDCIQSGNWENVELLSSFAYRYSPGFYQHGYPLENTVNRPVANRTALQCAFETGFSSENINFVLDHGVWNSEALANHPSQFLHWVQNKKSSFSRNQEDQHGERNTVYHYLAKNSTPDGISAFIDTLFSNSANATSPDTILNQNNSHQHSPLDIMINENNRPLMSAILARVRQNAADQENASPSLWKMGVNTFWNAASYAGIGNGTYISPAVVARLEAALNPEQKSPPPSRSWW